MNGGAHNEMPLFPLHTVLFPGGRLPLQIFEARYLDMIGRCLREDGRFVVVLIKDGDEVVRKRGDAPPLVFDIGTEARIANWDGAQGGRLLVTAEGENRVRIDDSRLGENHLMLGQVARLHETTTELNDRYAALRELLDTLMLHPMIQRLGVEAGLYDTARTANLLAQYLPIDERRKQELLMLDDPEARLQEVATLVKSMQES